MKKFHLYGGCAVRVMTGKAANSRAAIPRRTQRKRTAAVTRGKAM